MSRLAERELDAAGITDPGLRTAYLMCRRLNAEHGKTYYLATLLLPPAKRPAVHALYGFARWVDDLIDEGGGLAAGSGPLTIVEQGQVLDEVQATLLAGTAGSRPFDTAGSRPFDTAGFRPLGTAGSRPLEVAPSIAADAPPVVLALRDAMTRWQLPASHLVDFLASMRMDLTVTEYQTFADLERYMWGSAAVIGLLMVPVLGPLGPVEVAAPYAADLGVAFQLTNFLRDVGDDLRRGRIYLPMESLRHHGVDRAHLQRGVVDGPVRRLMADEIARTREIYRCAAPGVRLLHPDSRDCVRTALQLYSDILTEIERSGYRVLDRRVRVSQRRRARVALPGAARAYGVRRRHD